MAGRSVFERTPRTFGGLTLPSDRPYLIAEAGVNHENSLDTALRMVDAAAAAGADAIKFQSYRAGSLASRNSPAYWDTDKEPTRSQYELFRRHDLFGEAQYRELARRAQSCGIAFMSTPFDTRYADFLAEFMPAFKVASADLTNTPLLRHCARFGKPVLLSTGASTLGEIDDAVSVLLREGAREIALLHCVLSYPCRPEDANLGAITHLRSAFPDCVIGYSDHVPPVDNLLPTAWLLGARIVEKHFTLDKALPGNDHYHAMDPDDLRKLRGAFAEVDRLVGSSRKAVLRCEEEARRQARRSLVAARDLPRGAQVGSEDLEVKRPGTGIAPKHLEQLIGRVLERDVPADTVLQWEMFRPG